jgi:hypothetical protein
MTKDGTIVHILHEGKAFCGLDGLPVEWPAGHKWVALHDAGAIEDASCPACLAAATNAALGQAIPEGIHAQGSEGKYDGEAAAVLEVGNAEAVILIIKQGTRGDGFSVAIDLRKTTAQRILASVPSVLRQVAAEIEQRIKRPGSENN